MPAPKIATKTKPAALIIGGTALALLLMWVFAYAPTLTRKAAAETAHQAASDNNEMLGGQVRLLKGAAKNKATLAEQVAAFVQQFPSSADQPGTFRAIQDAAKTAGVSVSSFTSSVPAQATPAAVPTGVTNLVTARPGLTIMAVNSTAAQADAPAAGPAAAVIFPIQGLQVSIKVGGSMDQITSFIKILESLNRPVLVSSISISGGSGTPVIGAVSSGSADIVLQVFIAKPLSNPSTTPSVPTTVPTTAVPTP